MAKSSAIPAALKRLVVSRASGYCEYCKSPAAFSTEPFSIEHILPRSKKGADESANLAYACIGCNVYKSDLTEFLDVVAQQMTPLFNPRVMDWPEHFIWDEAFTCFTRSSLSRELVIRPPAELRAVCRIGS